MEDGGPPNSIDDLAPFIPGAREIFLAQNPRHPRPRTVPRRKEALICRDYKLDLPILADLTVHNVSGGAFYGDNIEVTGLCNLTEPLIVIAQQNVTVTGHIIPFGGIANMLPMTPQVGVTIIALQGQATIAQGAVIDAAHQAPPGFSPVVSGPRAVAVGGPGLNAMPVSISGETVVIEGFVRGIDGGSGGACEALGVPDPRTGDGGSAIAISGPGGWGGDVVIAACESIVVGPAPLPHTFSVGAGGGGDGGRAGPRPAPPGARLRDKAFARAGNGEAAIAFGADGGPGGDVIFVGFGRTPCAVTIQGGAVVFGGGGGRGSNTFAESQGATGVGGGAYARGGDGRDGGDVRFIHCVVTNNGTIESGDGAKGGDAESQGGAGAWTNTGGKDGGQAWAHGGDGGAGGPRPSWDNPQGRTVRGAAGSSEDGGSGRAVGGAGGDDLGGGNPGGSSGPAAAQGGAAGSGVAATPETQTPQGPTGVNGGTGQAAESAGASP